MDPDWRYRDCTLRAPGNGPIPVRAHQWFCRRFGLAVFDVCYFRLGNPCGYVVHEHPRKASQSIWISVGPFLINSGVGAVIAAPAYFSVFEFSHRNPFNYVLAWLGVSIAVHAIPSTGDAKAMWDATVLDPSPSKR